MMNIMNGGAHANNALDVQEFMVMPVGAPDFREAVRMGAEIFHTLKSLLSKAGHSTAVGDEGGFAPAINSTDEALDYITRSIETAGYAIGKDALIALDAAATELYRDGKYHLEGEGRSLTSDEMVDMWAKLVGNHPIVSLEDPMDEEDWDGFAGLTASVGDKVQIVGDDLFVTNPARLARGIEADSANAILVKVNQIGTPVRNASGCRNGAESRLWRCDLAPQWRDRGQLHRRSGGCHQCRPDQDRLAVAL